LRQLLNVFGHGVLLQLFNPFGHGAGL
jgi:hypothetical protein